MSSSSILKSSDELDSSVYSSSDIMQREVTERTTFSQDGSSIGDFLTKRHPRDQMTMEREQVPFQRYSQLIAVRRERSNTYHSSRDLRVPSRTDASSPYFVPSYEANRSRRSPTTSEFATSSAPSRAFSPASAFYGRDSPRPSSSVSMRTQNFTGFSAPVTPVEAGYGLQTVTPRNYRYARRPGLAQSRSQSYCGSTALSSASYTLDRMPDAHRHLPSEFSSTSSAPAPSSLATTTSTSSGTTAAPRPKKKSLRAVAQIKAKRAQQRLSTPSIKLTLQIDVTTAPLTEAQRQTNGDIASRFRKNWEMQEPPGKPATPSQEWNPAREGHKLMDLVLPRRMLLDCVFDARHLETEDIVNIEIHADPFVELFRTCGRVELMEQARLHWRELREKDDARLRAHLDVLADLKEAGVITPFAPVARYLEAWGEWRICCELAGSSGTDESGKHCRPKIHRSRAFLALYGATALEDVAGEKLKSALMAKGLEGAWEREIMARLASVKKGVSALCKERGSPFMLDLEGLKILQAAQKMQV